MNHCYVEAPGAGETVATNDGSQIWLQNVCVRDPTGSMTVAGREKAALALSGCDSLPLASSYLKIKIRRYLN